MKIFCPIRMFSCPPSKNKQVTSLIFVIDEQNSPYITEAQQQMIRLICKKGCRLYSFASSHEMKMMVIMKGLTAIKLKVQFLTLESSLTVL